jgi:predicted  nucleic acid-binding Zn-ribbon protein
LKERLQELVVENNKKRKEYSDLTQTLDTERENLKSLTQYLQNELDKLERG